MHLQGWENLLAPYLARIELLSEMPLDRAAHTQLEQVLANFVQRHGLTEATRRLRQDYPAAFVAYLAFKAAFNEDRGFWDNVARAIGLESPQPLFHPAHHWGQTFLEIIASHPNLRQFRGVSGLEYVTPIRLHGGIPVFSLPDFFQFILLPSVEKAPYDGLDDAEALRQLLDHYTARLFVDDVVRHFFQHSGAAGQSFFSNCRRMARLAQAGQPLPAPAELGLRPYVVQAFETFQERQTPPALRRRRPRLFFDPYDPGFRIVLPPQPLNLEQAGQRLEARLSNPETGDIYAAQTRLRPVRHGQDWFSPEVEWTLEEPLPSTQAGLFAAGQEKPLYTYPLRLLPSPGYPPLLAFDYENARQISLASSLPARSLWLLYPADCDLHVEPAARRLQSLPPFGPPWQDWQAAAYDLSETRLLRLLHAEQDVCPPISVSRPLEPSLSPSSLPPHVLAVEEKPLYNAAPQVCLPLQNPVSPAAELDAWTLRLESRYAARPQGTWEAKASDLPFVIENGEARLSLADWLGEQPVGTYHLSLEQRGRLVSELPFRVCAGIQISGLRPYYLPDANGASEVSFQVHLPAGVSLYAEDDETTLSPISPDGRGSGVDETPPSPLVGEGGWGGEGLKVGVFPRASQANLRLELPAEPEAIRLPLQVAVPRLRWALMLEKGAAIEWTHQPVARSLAELLQANQPRLRVELPLMDSAKPLAALHLTAPGVDRPLQAPESRSLSAQWLEFNLAGFSDTLRAHPEESVFEFRLELLDAGQELNTTLPVLRLSRPLEIQTCHMEATPDGGWTLHWYEPRPLRHRRLRVWSLWQPWLDPIEIPLPDDAPPSDSAPSPGWWMTPLPPEVSLPPAHYRAEFVAVAPYEKNPLSPLPPPHALKIEMLTPQARLAQLESVPPEEKPSLAFARRFEKLCVYHSLGRRDKVQEEIQGCLAHWRDASLIHLEALVRWLGEYESKENCRAFLMYLFREENLKRLEEERHPPEFVQRYLNNLRDARTIHPESARRVLKLAREPEVILRALQLLLTSSAEESRRVFWDLLAQGRLSETDAAVLLKDSPEFARHLLQESPASPMHTRLLRALSRHMDLPEYLVKVGYSVLCDAGWGRILEIRGAQRENLFFPTEETPTLVIEFLHWAGQTAELDLARNQLTLTGRSGVNRCACGRFAALGGKDTSDQWKTHRAFCGQTDVSPLPASFPLTFPPVYRAAAPENPLDTRSPGG